MAVSQSLEARSIAHIVIDAIIDADLYREVTVCINEESIIIPQCPPVIARFIVQTMGDKRVQVLQGTMYIRL